ncbi:flagellar hook capping FlgD N-terminal domain-containing protein [Neotabrizicola sp. VNH66]|uniref:flagellar hook capping FlgD N-terminal domain-containing protein n=1 Tax=Neotabrizicola sp. VNH66 TaxID=3400918 RepID=UPI003BFA7EBD
MTVTSPASGTPSSDYQTFLKMLTVQMQNQDPLNPMESSEFAVQLATFSGVEQQVVTNQLLTAMGNQFALVGMSQLAGWVGQEARAPADVWFSGSPITVSPNPVQGADRAVIVVRDTAGNTVSREEIPVSAEPYQWLGGDAAGNPLPAGRYSLSLESWENDAVVQEDRLEHYGRVVEVRGSAAGTVLVLEGGIEVPAAAITALRRAPG